MICLPDLNVLLLSRGEITRIMTRRTIGSPAARYACLRAEEVIVVFRVRAQFVDGSGEVVFAKLIGLFPFGTASKSHGRLFLSGAFKITWRTFPPISPEEGLRLVVFVVCYRGNL